MLVIALLVFGPKRLPELGQSLGRGISEFRDGLQNLGEDDEDDEDEEDDEGDSAEIAAIEAADSAEDPPLPDEEPEVTEVKRDSAADPSVEAEPVDGEVLPDQQD